MILDLPGLIVTILSAEKQEFLGLNNIKFVW